MPHPDIDNRTALVAEPLLLLDEQGRAALTLVVKASFALAADGQLSSLEEQTPLDYAGELWFPDAEVSSYRVEPELAPIKLATDIAVIAHAHAPGGRAAVVDVGVAVGSQVVQARVFGDRCWVPRGRGEFVLSRPQPFERAPVCYERAYGGTLTSPEGALDLEPRNPVGRGYIGHSGVPFEGQAAANIEDPRAAIVHPRDQPTPVGFGFVSPNWTPRASLAGSYDRAWEATRQPLLPNDFELGFYNAGSPGLIAHGYLRGDEPIVAVNLTPAGRLAFTLPGLDPPRARVSLMGHADQSPTLNFDTLILDLDRGIVSMLWRARVALSDGFHNLHAIEITQ